MRAAISLVCRVVAGYWPALAGLVCGAVAGSLPDLAGPVAAITVIVTIFWLIANSKD